MLYGLVNIWKAHTTKSDSFAEGILTDCYRQQLHFYTDCYKKTSVLIFTYTAKSVNAVIRCRFLNMFSFYLSQPGSLKPRVPE